MSFATSTTKSSAGQPTRHCQTPPPRRGRGACCVAAVAALALSVSSSSVAVRGGDPAPSVAAHGGAARTDAVHLGTPHLGRDTATGGATAVEPIHALAKRTAFVQSRRVCVRLANVRSGPGLSYRVVATARRGTVVRGTTSHGWLRIRGGRWISYSLTCGGSTGHTSTAGGSSFAAWVRVIDPTGNASWSMDYGRRHTPGVTRGLTVFRSSGPTRSTVYIQPGMSWAKTKLVMAHEAIHVRQVRYGGYAHSLRVFGSITGLESAADCGASLILHEQVRGGCRAGQAPRVRRLLSGRPA